MKFLPQNNSELFITRMRWLVIFGSPLLFSLTGLPMDTPFWVLIWGTAIINLYIHLYLLFRPTPVYYSHFLSVVDTVFASTLLFVGGENQADLHQLYYFIILVLGIRYGIKSYLGLVFIIGVVYTSVVFGGAAFHGIPLDRVDLATQLIYFFAFGILTSFILERENRQHLEKEDLISELQSAYRQLCIYNAKVEEMASKDPLTDLYNYRYFSERLNMEVDWAKKYYKPLSIILIDIDHFKNFNDTYGHPAGDIALQTAAKVFLENIRDRDVLARYGGEEFLVLLPDTAIKEAYQCAERIRQAIENTDIKIEPIETPVKITVSAGVASLSEVACFSIELLENADRALYQAKRSGRNMVRVYGNV